MYKPKRYTILVSDNKSDIKIFSDIKISCSYDNITNFESSNRSLKYLDVFTPMLQKDLLPPFYPAEQLVRLGQV